MEFQANQYKALYKGSFVQVIPNIINWTTFPIMSLIKMMWVEQTPHLIEGGDVTPHDIKFMAMLG